MTGPLVGLRVVDLSHGSAGHRATGLLADYGADVIWVEPPGGDPLRVSGPEEVAVHGRGKRSVLADLDAASDRERIVRLVQRADVLVASWGPERPCPPQFGWPALHQLNPRLVACAISGFGDWTLGAGLPAYEAIVHAILGTMAEQQGMRDGPIFQGLPFASIGASYLAAIGILAALVRREDDHVGRHVETSLVDGALAYHSMMWGESDASIEVMEKGGAKLGDSRQATSITRLITRSFECADGTYLGIHTGAVGAFGRFMKVVGLDDRVPPSETGMDIGVALTDEQITIVADELPKIFITRPRREWVQLFLDADVCAVEHLQPTEVFDTPQARHNEMVLQVDDPVLGRVEQVGLPAKFSSTQPLPPSPTPLAGQHSAEVFASDGGWHPLAGVEPGKPCLEPLLAGLKILDLGAYYAGPYSSRLLADLGADVIKVEPLLGDQMRGIERPFFSAQAGKRSLAANLKDPGLTQAVERLLAWADVIHHNLRPGAAERLGLGEASVRAVKPDIVYLYAPGWGSAGPFKMRQAFAPMLSGYVGATYEVAGQYNPPMPPIANEDPGNGLLGAAAVLMALLHRKRTGGGQYVENPQLNATMTHLSHVVRRPDGEVLGAARMDPLQFGTSAYERLYEAADGWVCVVAPHAGERVALAGVLGISDLPSDDDMAAAAIADAVATRPATEVVAELRTAGVAAVIPAGRNVNAFMNDPQQRVNGRVAEEHHVVKGAVRELAHLVRISDAAVVPHRLAPDLGEHTDEILTWLGYDAGTIANLRATNAVR